MARLVDGVHQVWNGNRRDDADDRHHDEQLDQGEAGGSLPFGCAVSGHVDHLLQRRIAHPSILQGGCRQMET
jgi:hypothetical protein